MNAGEDIKLELPQVGIGRRTEAETALKDVFRAQYPRLISVLARVTSDRAQAEELASEVFCKLAKRPVLFGPGNILEGLLYRAQRVCTLSKNERRRINRVRCTVQFM